MERQFIAGGNQNFLPNVCWTISSKFVVAPWFVFSCVSVEHEWVWLSGLHILSELKVLLMLVVFNFKSVNLCIEVFVVKCLICKVHKYCIMLPCCNKGGGVAEWFRTLDLKSSGPWFKSSSLLLFRFVLVSPEFNSSTALCKGPAGQPPASWFS